jgi:predicted aspartyl protease
MPVRNYPFSIIRPGDLARPYLPITIINPGTEIQIKVYALVDTGADSMLSQLHSPLFLDIIYKLASSRELVREMGSRLRIAIPIE